MKSYILNDIAVFQPGTLLGLSDVQAAPRVHALKKLGGGRYEVIAAVQFKVGEAIGVEGDLPKGMATAVVDEKAVAAAAKADKSRRDKAAAAERARIADEVYAELLAVLPAELRTQVEQAVAAATKPTSAAAPAPAR